MAKAKGTDPLIGAMIDKLPAPGQAWPAEARVSWLRMMHMTFDLVYGGAAGGAMSDAALELPAFLAGAAAAKPVPTLAAPAPAKPPKPDPDFYIDHDGHARDASGQTILPGDIAGVIFDKRGELGDLSAIIWADGTRGVRGLHLEISTSV